MIIKILREAGYAEALLGLSLSHNGQLTNMPGLARRLCKKDGGHNKFLESIVVWLDITAPRYWHQQFDTYRAGVTKQSESTMHTALHHPLTHDDFEGYVHQPHIDRCNKLIRRRDLAQLKRELPEAFLQRRIVCTNYKTLRRMYQQRHTHKLAEWAEFCKAIVEQLEHGEFVR